jgi:hypothetical protein
MSSSLSMPTEKACFFCSDVNKNCKKCPYDGFQEMERKLAKNRRCINGRDPIDKKPLHWAGAVPCKNKAVTEILFICGWLEHGPLVLYVPVCQQHRQEFIESYMRSHIRPSKAMLVQKIIEALRAEGWQVRKLRDDQSCYRERNRHD